MLIGSKWRSWSWLPPLYSVRWRVIMQTRPEQSRKRRNPLDKSHLYPDNTITSGYNEALSDRVSHYMLHRICWDQAYRFR